MGGGVIGEQLFNLWQAECVLVLKLHDFPQKLQFPKKEILFRSPLNGEMAYLCLFL
jgi:hypothetical protein